MNRHRPFDADLDAALPAFNADSSVFREGISELTAQEYLRLRAKIGGSSTTPIANASTIEKCFASTGVN